MTKPMTTTEALELEGVLLAELRGRAEADDDIVRMTPERLERWWRTPAKFVTSDQDMSTFLYGLRWQVERLMRRLW